MGDEAGQPLKGIIARKDAERELGGGLFFWGIGTALGERLWRFIGESKKPFVLFSPMRAKARPLDVRPERVFAWTTYLDKNGRKHPIPDHVFVTSRGSTAISRKSRHYALVCEKNASLLGEQWPSIHWNMLSNFEAYSNLGYSQVTAVVEVRERSHLRGPSYEVLFGAQLVPPYYVTLTDPVEIPNSLIATVNAFWETDGRGIHEWREWLVRHRAKPRLTLDQ